MLSFNFRRLALATVAAAALGVGNLAAPPPAHAVNLADDNQGEVALFQYFTVRNGWQTFLRIINTSGDTVAVKVRFREAYNSREVLDFTLVLSPWDMWNGWTDANAGGPGIPGLITDDNSCTAPGIGSGGFVERIVPLPDGRDYPTKYVPFKNISYQDDGGPTGIDRALEGYAEVISLGRIPGSTPTSISDAAAHDSNGVPSNCGLVASRLDHTNPTNLASAAAEFIEPRNVLKANGYLFKGATGQGAGFDPVMLANFFNPEEDPTGPPPNDTWFGVCFNNEVGDCELTALAGPGYDDLIEELSPTHPNAAPGGATPDLNHAFPPVSKIRIDDQQFFGFGPVFGAASPVQVTDEWDRGIDAVSAVLARTAINNEWAARETVGFAVSAFQTEWVVTFPTKHYYVDRDSASIWATLGDGLAIAPFSEVFQPNGESCEPIEIDVWNREEGKRTDTSPFDPPGQRSLCREANIITFRADELGTNLTDNVADTIMVSDLPDPTLPEPPEPFTQYEGWMHLEFTGANAQAGLGSDPEANQIYDGPFDPAVPVPPNADPILIYMSVAQAGLADYSDAWITAETGAAPTDQSGAICGGPVPAIEITVDGNGNIDGAGLLAGLIQSFDPNAGNLYGTVADLIGGVITLPATLFEIGTYSRPYLAGALPAAVGVVPLAVTVLQDVTCAAAGNLNYVAEVEVADLVAAAQAAGAAIDPYPVTYTGLPVIGFNFSLLNSGSAERNYASVTDHGYEREVLVEAICNARFAHGPLQWVLAGTVNNGFAPQGFNNPFGQGPNPLCPVP